MVEIPTGPATPKPHRITGTARVTSKTGPKTRENVETLDQTGPFSKVLDKELNPSYAGKGPETDSGLPELQGTFRARAVATGPVTAKAGTAEVIADLESLMGRMETYTQWLSDPGKTLKQAQGLLLELSDQVRALSGKITSGKTGQPSGREDELAGMANRLAAMVEIEQIKVSRGDYL